jgi:hypothetical protein
VKVEYHVSRLSAVTVKPGSSASVDLITYRQFNAVSQSCDIQFGHLISRHRAKRVARCFQTSPCHVPIPKRGTAYLIMLPLHRLAAQQQQSRGPVVMAGFYLRSFCSSRLATRVLILLVAFVFLLIFMFPSSYSEFRPNFSWFDDGSKHLPPPSPNRPGGNSPSPPPLDEQTIALWASRASLVKQSFLHAWDGYDKYAFGFDELLPLSNGTTTNLNGWGVTIVDSLSTMQLMGLDDAYDRAMVHVKKMRFKNHVCWSISMDLVAGPA